MSSFERTILNQGGAKGDSGDVGEDQEAPAVSRVTGIERRCDARVVEVWIALKDAARAAGLTDLEVEVEIVP